MSHVMIDLETWGVRPGCGIRSIGAVVFDPNSKRIGSEFYINVSQKSCLALGLRQEKATIEWWAQPENAKAREAFEQIPAVTMKVAIQRFDKWFRRSLGKQLWSHGSNFDEPIMVCVYDLLKMQTPWKFWDARCTRTLYDAANFNPRDVTREGTYHNALDDAKHQARCVQIAVEKLKCE